MTISEQMHTAGRVMSIVENFDPTCILAGGAPRDWWFGNTATDLDIFFFSRKNATIGYTEKLFNKAFGKGEVSLIPFAGEKMNYKLNPDLQRVWQAEIEGQKVQFMEMNKPTFEVIHHFPLTICKAWYKGGFIHTDRLFQKSALEKVIIKTNPLYADGEKYINKIRDKFPEFKYYNSYEQYFKGE